MSSVSYAGDGNKSASTAHVQFADHGALGTQRETIRRIFYVASRDDSTIVDKCGSANTKLRIGNVCVCCGFIGSIAKCYPINCRSGHNATLLAAGAFHFFNCCHHLATQFSYALHSERVVNRE